MPGVRPPSLQRKKVLLVDDHPLMRAGLAQLINRQPDLVVCAEAANSAEALHLLPRTKPHLVLADLAMPGRAGVDFIMDIVAREPELPVLVVSMHDEMVHGERCLRAGARGYIMKESGSDKLLMALRRVLEGQTYVSPAVLQHILGNIANFEPTSSDLPVQSLTDREFEIFLLIGQGKLMREIAGQLQLSPKTIDVYRAHIRDKFKLKNVAALGHHAVQWLQTRRLAD